MTSSLSNGRSVFLSVFCLLCSCLSSFAENLTLLQIRNNSATTSMFVHYRISATKGTSPAIFDGTMSPGQVRNVQFYYWGAEGPPPKTECWSIDEFSQSTGYAEFPTPLCATWETNGTDAIITIELYGGTPAYYLPVKIINDTAWDATVGMGIKSPINTNFGPGILPAGGFAQYCFGVYTNRADWYVYTLNRSLSSWDGMFLTNIVSSNLVHYGSPNDGWRTNCTPYREVYLSGRFETNTIHPTDTPLDFNWNGTNGNPSWVNTNLSPVASQQIADNAILQELKSMHRDLTNASGSSLDVGPITNLLGKIYQTSSNELYAATNGGLMGIVMPGGTLSNTVYGQMTSASNTVRSGVGNLTGKVTAGSPSFGTDIPSTPWGIPAMNGEVINFDIPWTGGSGVSGFLPALPTWLPSAVRSLIAVVMICDLWLWVVNDAVNQFKWLLTVGQTRVMKGQILGTSVALPVFLVIAAVMLAILFAVPAALMAMLETAGWVGIGSFASNMTSLSSIASGQGVWGLFQLFVPVTTALTCVGLALTWFVASNGLVCAVGAMYKAFLAD